MKRFLSANVGLSWEETKARAPADVLAACHNSAESVTVSGPPESIRKFCEQLTSEKIFAREVKSSGFAFHSKYIADAGPKLRQHLERVSVSLFVELGRVEEGKSRFSAKPNFFFVCVGSPVRTFPVGQVYCRSYC